MPSTIERRHKTVTLYTGNYQSELTDLLDQAMAAKRAEDSSGAKRANTRSLANALAKQYDDLLTEAEGSALHVDVYEISHVEYQRIADVHPPRKDHPEDAASGINKKTFLDALLRASVGTEINIDELSMLHYNRLAAAVWKLHMGDDALPKFSLVSLLKAERDAGSKPPAASE